MAIDANDFSEDAPSIPTPRGASAVDNKFDGVENPDQGEVADINVTFSPNEFPHQTGHDTLATEEALLT